MSFRESGQLVLEDLVDTSECEICFLPLFFQMFRRPMAFICLVGRNRLRPQLISIRFHVVTYGCRTRAGYADRHVAAVSCRVGREYALAGVVSRTNADPPPRYRDGVREVGRPIAVILATQIRLQTLPLGCLQPCYFAVLNNQSGADGFHLLLRGFSEVNAVGEPCTNTALPTLRPEPPPELRFHCLLLSWKDPLGTESAPDTDSH